MKDLLIITLLSLALSSCATLKTHCTVGLGLDVGEPSMRIYEVVKNSAADKAGVIAEGTVWANESDWPVSGVEGEVVKLTVHYPMTVKVFHIKQAPYCVDLW